MKNVVVVPFETSGITQGHHRNLRSNSLLFLDRVAVELFPTLSFRVEIVMEGRLKSADELRGPMVTEGAIRGLVLRWAGMKGVGDIA